MAPFGLPVVPEVYMNAQVSSRRTGAVGSLAEARSMSAS